MWSCSDPQQIPVHPPLNNISNNKQNIVNNDNDNNNNGFGCHNMNDDQNQCRGNERSLCDYLQQDKTIQPSYIIFPSNIGHFEIKSRVVQVLPKFHGMDKERLYLHFHEFEEI